jgi:hypothetical protein
MKPLPVVAVVALALGSMGCLSTGPGGSLPLAGGESGASRLGSFSASVAEGGASGASWSVEDAAPAACVSGEHQVFFGADFPDPRKGAVLRLVVDPVQGAAVRVFDPADPERRSAVVRPEACRTFRYRIEPTGWRINDYRDFHVELQVDCPMGDAAGVKAEVSAAHCH